MRLQPEILLHPAVRWGEDASLLVVAAVVAAVLLLQDCLRGIGTPGSSGIMVLGRQWPPLPLPPPCYMPPQLLLPPLPPPRLLQRLKLIYLTATATSALMMTAAVVRLLSQWEIKARPPLSVFLEMMHHAG